MAGSSLQEVGDLDVLDAAVAARPALSTLVGRARLGSRRWARPYAIRKPADSPTPNASAWAARVLLRLARELNEPLLVNHYGTDHFAEAIRKAVEMPAKERQRRMRKMREVVRQNNIYKWAADIISEMLKFEFGEA